MTDPSVHDATAPGTALPPPPLPSGRSGRKAARKAASAARVTKWDRPPHPHDWRFWVGGTGRVLLAAGILMFGFVAYQLWGTGLETARAQRSLENEFEDLLAAVPDTTTAPTTVPATTPVSEPAEAEPRPAETVAPETVPPTTAPIAVRQDLPPIVEGDAIARIEMPSIGADHIVVAGVSVADLKRGPGHFPETPLPGQLGNAAIAGHRTTYGEPFGRVDDLAPGDEIVLSTLAGRFVYRVTGTEIVTPSDTHVLATTDPTAATVTLVSCHPKWSASKRIVVHAALDEAASDPVGLPTPYVGFPTETAAPATTLPPPTTSPTTVPATTAAGTTPGTAGDAAAPVTTTPATAVPPTLPAVSESSEDAFSGGWFSDAGAFPHVLLWGLAVTVISIGAWLLSRRTRHDSIGFVVGIAPFAVALFFFFQNVNRLLPPSL